MATGTPLFLTGGNARILMDNQTVAFATNVSYRVVVKHSNPRVLGRYEVEELHPLAYEVYGSLTIIRYASKLKEKLKSSAADISAKGNSIGSYSNGTQRLNEALDPGRLLQSKMFNIEIRQQIPGDEVRVFTLRDCRIDEIAFNIDKHSAATQTIRFTARYLDDDVFDAHKSGNGQELS
jgi:hypothetical protein